MKLILLISIASASVAACSGGARDTTVVVKQLRVWGPQERLTRFVRLQGSARHPLVVSNAKPLDIGQAQAVVTLPASYTGEDLVHTTREALVAGLSYRYEERKLTRAARS
ncbi:hypothetical protein [Sphingomonas sp. TDK1]|uniref:hypothetical protein n=1 Tax=Sphingomonas sp. TDK1 TaxID=453247 RepID=UPI0012ED5777|nr:hypothetical protein [Sphingomonas sp. TDK1]